MLKKTNKMIPLYGGMLNVVITDNMGKFAASKGLDANVDYEAMCFQQGSSIYILFQPHTELHYIVHECKHAVNYTFKRVGYQLDIENDEPECYLLMWIFNQCLKTKTAI
jgi:hypothetical protein